MIVSIAMTTYNGERFIREQLDSILNQTYKDFEIVICDDCSTDSTYNILKQYGEKDTRIKLYRNAQNLGFVRNFEKVISLCKGEYVALSDQDDIWTPNHLSVLLNSIGEKSLVCGDIMLIKENGSLLSNKRYSYLQGVDYLPDSDVDKAYSIIFFHAYLQGASMLIRRRLLNIALPIPERIPYHDVWFSLVACFTDGFNFVSEVITYHRRHNNNHSWFVTDRIYKFWTFINHIKTSDDPPADRKIYIQAIKDRIKPTNASQNSLIADTEKYISRKNAFIGRLKNMIYELKHFKLIYRYKGNYIFDIINELIRRVKLKF